MGRVLQHQAPQCPFPPGWPRYELLVWVISVLKDELNNCLTMDDSTRFHIVTNSHINILC